MKGNLIEADQMNGLENLMIELDNFDENLEQEIKKDNDENNQKKIKKHKKLKEKFKSKHIGLELVNSSQTKRKEKGNVIVIDENDGLELIKDLKLKDTGQNSLKKSINTTKNNISKSVEHNKQLLKCNSSFQENLRVKQKKTFANLKKETEIQTDNICDIKKLEIFHLLKISQNFILSMHSLTEKIIKMYV